MTRRYLLAAALSVMALAVVPAVAQQFLQKNAVTQPNPKQTPSPTPAPSPTPQYPPQGNDSTSSLGSFKIQIMPQFVSLFYNAGPPAIACPGFDPTTNILSSPPLSDPTTLIGRSSEIPDGGNADMGGVPVGVPSGIIQPTNVGESMLIPPPGFPCSGVSNCSSGSGTAEVHTAIESLHLVGSGAAVRAGQWYNNATTATWPPNKISPGEVESQSGPNGTAATFFPASSFFGVYVQVDMPACPAFTNAFPGGTLYNLMPLVVKNNNVTTFPPQVVYLHDSTSIVPILFLTPDTAVNPPRWQKDDILGYFLLVGHGVGQTQDDFNKFMGNQSNATCPIGPLPPSGGAVVRPKTTQTATSSRKRAKTASRRNSKGPSAGNSASAPASVGGSGGGGGNR
jgi:hypothetical protein